jgi:Rrf2 family protein
MWCHDDPVEITAKSDYAVRALLGLAAHHPELVKAERLMAEQGLPRKFVESILGDLRRAGLVRSQRGADGGYGLSRGPDKIMIGSVIRAVDGPLAEVRGLRPHETVYAGDAEHLSELWVAVRTSLRRVLDQTSVAQVLSGRLPAHVKRMVDAPGAWDPR